MAGRVFTHCKAATMVAGAAGYGLVEDAEIAVEGGQIAWVGAASDLLGRVPHGPHGFRLRTPSLTK